MNATARAVIVIGACAAGSALHAHHGSTPHFDRDNTVELRGTVTDLKFVNPHAFVHFSVENDDGTTAVWRCELSGATTLRRQGWTAETLLPGQLINIAGAMARREANACLMDTISLDDGTVISNDTIRRFGELPVADKSATQDRPRYLENGQPNISGAWISRNGGGAGGPLANGPVEPSAAGLAASESFDVRYDNPVIRCESGNIISDWYRQSQINDIRQFDDRIVLRYGYLDMVRTIYLNAEHPVQTEPSVEGHSTGRWEGEVLVVDTVGLAERVLIPLNAVMMSERARITERFYFDEDELALYRDYMVDDPLYLNKSYVASNASDIAAAPYTPFNCVDLSGENNRRPAADD